MAVFFGWLYPRDPERDTDCAIDEKAVGRAINVDATSALFNRVLNLGRETRKQA
jgi:hypothetical protein